MLNYSCHQGRKYYVAYMTCNVFNLVNSIFHFHNFPNDGAVEAPFMHCACELAKYMFVFSNSVYYYFFGKQK